MTNSSSKSRKFNRRPIILAVFFIAILAPLIWFAREWFAEEYMIDFVTTDIQGQNLTVILREKSSSEYHSPSDASSHIDTQEKTTHYGYFLELYDSTSGQSLDKIKFKSPVWEIQSTPQMRVFPDGTIWLVSTSIYTDDRVGFILRFAVKDQKLVQSEFALDEKYHIRDLHENAVILSEGSSYSGGYWDPIFGNLYLDLETGKIADTRVKQGDF